MTNGDRFSLNRGLFQKGRSGNPGGRPKRSRELPSASAFAIVIDRMLPLMRDGMPTEISVEEALQQKTYQDALAGKRLAIRQVLRWIERREQWLAKHGRLPSAMPRIVMAEEPDPDNADEALVILGIADHQPDRPRREGERAHLLLEPWAVEAALGRRGVRARLTRKHVDHIRPCLRGEAPASLAAGREEEP